VGFFFKKPTKKGDPQIMKAALHIKVYTIVVGLLRLIGVRAWGDSAYNAADGHRAASAIRANTNAVGGTGSFRGRYAGYTAGDGNVATSVWF
jgi:hypothetical protein